MDVNGGKMASNNNSSGGISFIGLLTIVFIVLKLLGKITWSWWIILSPLWISTGIIMVLVAVWLTLLYMNSRKKL